MGLQDRYFGRWLLPIFPIACLLAAYFASRSCSRSKGDAAPRGGNAASASRKALAARRALIAIVLLAQGLLYSVHNDLVLSRADTRNITRAWMVAHVPRGTPIVVEPVVLDSWIEEGASGSRSDRWLKYQSLQSVIAPDGSLAPQTIHEVTLEDYETTLSPALIGWYEHLGYCWVVVGSTESGRALADPRAAPFASAYYHALATPGGSRLPRLALLAGEQPDAVQLRLVVRLLPAFLCASRAGNDRVSPARWALRS